MIMSTNSGPAGRYELQELLGKGGMAEVWKAFDTATRQYVAIKFLHASPRTDPDFAARFQREIQAIASLRHPNIIQYHDVSIAQPPGTGNTTASIVMDYIAGGTLADYIHTTARQGKFLQAAEIVRLFTSIGAAVDYAHQHGVVHGQLKPANVLLDRLNAARNTMGEPIVTDFGMVRLLAAASGNTSGWWLGTPLYTSPEQIMGSQGDARSDIYALGIMLYEICTGTPPFPGNNPATIMMQHINTIPASPALINPALPPGLITIIMRCIAKEPALRFPSVSALLADLSQVAGQEGSPIPSIPVAMGMSQPDALVNSNLPTILSAGLSPLPGAAPAALASSAPGLSGVLFAPSSGGPVSSPGMVNVSQPSLALSPGGPVTPMPPTFVPGPSVQYSPVASGTSPVVPPPARPGRRRTLTILTVLLVLLVIGASLGTYFTFFAKSSSGTTSDIVGHAYFVSSGLLSSAPESGQGITDQLQMKLENIPAPQPGKNYYGWLLNDKTLEWKPIPLGPLTVNNGTISLSYPGDALHSDLLATNSRFLITEEDAANPPSNPSLVSTTWRYYAEFSQVQHPFGSKMYSLYDHIRHLLADDPSLKSVGLTGGLDIWLYRNTQKILEWSGSARDSDLPGNGAFVRRQLTRVIDYLDGTFYDQHDLPGQPLLVDQTIGKIGLLTFDPVNQNPPGYLYHIGKHLHEISLLPEASPAQKALVIQINQDINVVNAWDETIRADVLQLLAMNDAQLAGNAGRSLLDTVATLANTAFVGTVTPQGQVQDGVVQIHYAIQNLATFDVRACTQNDPCPSLV